MSLWARSDDGLKDYRGDREPLFGLMALDEIWCSEASSPSCPWPEESEGVLSTRCSPQVFYDAKKTGGPSMTGSKLSNSGQKGQTDPRLYRNTWSFVEQAKRFNS
jgi:hypothetical protein